MYSLSRHLFIVYCGQLLGFARWKREHGLRRRGRESQIRQSEVGRNQRGNGVSCIEGIFYSKPEKLDRGNGGLRSQAKGTDLEWRDFRICAHSGRNILRPKETPKGPQTIYLGDIPCSYPTVRFSSFHNFLEVRQYGMNSMTSMSQIH